MASWIVVVTRAFRSDFGPNDPTGGTQRETERYGRPLRELNAMETLKQALLVLAVVCSGSSVVIANEIKAGDLVGVIFMVDGGMVAGWGQARPSLAAI
jgi:hypothetical protein